MPVALTIKSQPVDFFDDEMLDAIEALGRTEAQAKPGSPERWNGITLISLAGHYRQMRDRLAVADPDWRVEKYLPTFREQ